LSRYSWVDTNEQGRQHHFKRRGNGIDENLRFVLVLATVITGVLPETASAQNYTLG